MRVPTITIGLPPEWVAEIARRGQLERVIQYDTVPQVYSLDGEVYAQSSTVLSRWLQPNAVLWYGYFPDAEGARAALALSSIPTYPPIATTLPLDHKALALVLATRADTVSSPRGYMPAGVAASASRASVVKEGNAHCGEGKYLVAAGQTILHEGLVEPFFEGHSVRVLTVGVGPNFKAYQLRYESEDWRKNVGSTITREPLNPELAFRAKEIVKGLDLSVAGIDFILRADGSAELLEVNAYPSLDEVPEALDQFLSEASQVARGAQA